MSARARSSGGHREACAPNHPSRCRSAGRYAVLPGNPPDDRSVPASLEHHRTRFGRPPNPLAGDRGTYPLENERQATAARVRRVALLQPGRSRRSGRRTNASAGSGRRGTSASGLKGGSASSAAASGWTVAATTGGRPGSLAGLGGACPQPPDAQPHHRPAASGSPGGRSGRGRCGLRGRGSMGALLVVIPDGLGRAARRCRSFRTIRRSGHSLRRVRTAARPSRSAEVSGSAAAPSPSPGVPPPAGSLPHRRRPGPAAGSAAGRPTGSPGQPPPHPCGGRVLGRVRVHGSRRSCTMGRTAFLEARVQSRHRARPARHQT
jgi:hypothetical protein